MRIDKSSSAAAQHSPSSQLKGEAKHLTSISKPILSSSHPTHHGFKLDQHEIDPIRKPTGLADRAIHASKGAISSLHSLFASKRH